MVYGASTEEILADDAIFKLQEYGSAYDLYE